MISSRVVTSMSFVLQCNAMIVYRLHHHGCHCVVAVELLPSLCQDGGSHQHGHCCTMEVVVVISVGIAA